MTVIKSTIKLSHWSAAKEALKTFLVVRNRLRKPSSTWEDKAELQEAAEKFSQVLESFLKAFLIIHMGLRHTGTGINKDAASPCMVQHPDLHIGELASTDTLN